ncbi:uncharacterized protein G2W53_007288 [Senna tora]|uniref:Uncharacterized protein n=1 Tax=Senna tora TaxID=362788 RepID=A0A834X5V8_9FABA|nr:uncharacterized protein G2W53_007288 [Senna tora]
MIMWKLDQMDLLEFGTGDDDDDAQ